ncbi:helix-turn-helix domain-containing protein [Mesorhizobium sp. CA12]|uniref:helix-turn-helix domain-containing protein n=1 Tax=Mesorhizobium sp. CA12 TaxID=2876644 RepID=UPI001CCE5484|nr:helix-turn-helix domain-containing protein [Mesorhizobium sp. CA12]
MLSVESWRHAYTIKEFSRIYGVSRSFIYKEVARGNLEVRKAGRRTLILSDVADRWLQSLPVGAVRQYGEHLKDENDPYHSGDQAQSPSGGRRR